MFSRCSQRGNGLFFVYCTVAGSSSRGLRDRRWWGSCTAGSVICLALAGPKCYCQVAAQFFQGMRSARHCYGTCSDFCVPWKPLSYCFSPLTSRQVSSAVAENGGKTTHHFKSRSLNIASHRCDPRADGGGNTQVPFGSRMKVMLWGAVYQSEGKCSHVYNLYFINKKSTLREEAWGWHFPGKITREQHFCCDMRCHFKIAHPLAYVHFKLPLFSLERIRLKNP